MKANLNEVWELINNLTLDEKKIIYTRMEREVNSKLLDLLDRIYERAENGSISFEEITNEVEDIRGNLYRLN